MKPIPRVIIALFLLGIVPRAGLAQDAEEIFADAARYTVRLDVTISTPFVEDSQGVHSGAGFVVDKNRRWVMTNAHVAGYSPSQVQVAFADGSRIESRKVYVDPFSDIAVIELLDGIPFDSEAPLACTANVGTGHAVGAYGHPWGLNFTGTRGVISGRTSRWGAELLQTDTPINSGNSGGPLISMKSAGVVGISSLTYGGDDAQNTNFAVPIDQACRILELLKEGRDPSPPALATTFYMMAGDNGPLVVARTFLGDEELQLQVDDEILSANGTAISTESQLVHALRGRLDAVRMAVRRGGKVIELAGTLDPRPQVHERDGVYFAGLLIANGGYRDGRVLETGHDVMIHSIASGSTADGAGLWVYDIVSRVNNVAVRNLSHLKELLNTQPAHGKVQMDFLRVMEDSDTKQLFWSVRRNFNWSEPTLLGRWDAPDGKTGHSRKAAR